MVGWYLREGGNLYLDIYIYIYMSGMYVDMLTFILFNYLITTTCLALSEFSTVFCRFYNICFPRILCFICVPSYRATFFSPEKEEKKRFCFFSGLAGSLSLFFTGSLKFILHFQCFPPFFLSFRLRACTRSTVPWASPASSRVSAGAGGWRGGCKERGRRFRG